MFVKVKDVVPSLHVFRCAKTFLVDFPALWDGNLTPLDVHSVVREKCHVAPIKDFCLFGIRKGD